MCALLWASKSLVCLYVHALVLIVVVRELTPFKDDMNSSITFFYTREYIHTTTNERFFQLGFWWIFSGAGLPGPWVGKKSHVNDSHITGRLYSRRVSHMQRRDWGLVQRRGTRQRWRSDVRDRNRNGGLSLLTTVKMLEHSISNSRKGKFAILVLCQVKNEEKLLSIKVLPNGSPNVLETHTPEHPLLFAKVPPLSSASVGRALCLLKEPGGPHPACWRREITSAV